MAATGKSGVVGLGQEFDGTADNIPIDPDCRPTTAYSISAWMKTTTSGAVSQSILADRSSSGHFGYNFEINSRSLIAEANTGNPNVGRLTSAVLVGVWTYVTATWSLNGQFAIYVDGVLGTNGTFNTDNNPISYNNATGTYICRPGKFFSGLLDEVRIMRNISSQSWVTLCYETQKPGSSVVTVEQIP